jgi:hypothetical protein
MSMTDRTLTDTISSMEEDNDIDMTVGMDQEQLHQQQGERPPPRLMITKMVCAAFSRL